jgi:hypothetical protein
MQKYIDAGGEHVVVYEVPKGRESGIVVETDTGTAKRSATAGSCVFAPTWTVTRPSKPPGCGRSSPPAFRLRPAAGAASGD